MFDIHVEVNNANHNHKEVLNFDHDCCEKHLGSPRFKIATFITSFNVTKIPNTSPLDEISDGIYNAGVQEGGEAGGAVAPQSLSTLCERPPK